MSGFIMLPRKLLEDEFFANDEYSKMSAFLWMVKEAQLSADSQVIGGKSVTIERGQFSHSTRFMARAWNWNESKVRRYLKAAEKSGKITIKKPIKTRRRNDAATDSGSDATNDAAQNVITICNYSDFSGLEKDNDAAGDASNDARSDEKATQTLIIKKRNNNMSDFDRFYQQYPKKERKQLAVKAFTAALKKASVDDIMAGLKRYLDAKYKPEEGAKYIMQPHNWLNEESWNANYSKPGNNPSPSLPQYDLSGEWA